jgi:hypothetical protein
MLHIQPGTKTGLPTHLGSEAIPLHWVSRVVKLYMDAFIDTMGRFQGLWTGKAAGISRQDYVGKAGIIVHIGRGGHTGGM